MNSRPEDFAKGMVFLWIEKNAEAEEERLNSFYYEPTFENQQ